MANHESTKKDIRRNARRRERNRQAITMMRTLARKVEEAVTAGKTEEAKAIYWTQCRLQQSQSR